LVLLLESELWPNLIMSAAAKGVSGFLIILEHDQITVHDHAYFLVPSVHPSLNFFILQEQNFYLDYS
jgi:3-deoxy-D-manno-octulosonic-acid transferase